MHTAGKVFTVLISLVAVGFAFLTAKVVDYRIEKRKDLDQVKARIPQTEKAILEFDLQRDILRDDLDRMKTKAAQALTAGLNQQELLDGRIAVLTDLVNDAGSKLKTWSASLVDAQAENAARAKEIEELEAAIAEGEKTRQELTAANETLAAQLAETRAAMAKLNAEVQANHERLLRLEESKRSSGTLTKLASAAEEANDEDR